jgi:hypothetical protein
MIGGRWIGEESITEGSSATNKLPKLLRKKLPYSKSAMIQSFGEKESTIGIDNITAIQQDEKDNPTTPSIKYLKLITPLPRKLASILSNGTHTKS